MTQSSPPQTHGQIDAPNPLELLWEKYRRPITLVLVIALVVIGGFTFWGYEQHQETNTLWSRAMEVANLDQAYSQDNALASFFLSPNQQQRSGQAAGQYLGYAREGLVQSLREDLAKASPSELQKAIEQAKGTAAEPILLWLMAVRDVENRDYDAALAKLDDLEKRFPNHFLTASSPYPPQVRPELESAKEKEKPKTPKKQTGVPEAPKLEPAVAGSPVEMLRKQIEEQRKFRQENPWLYEPPPTAPEPKVVVHLSTDESFTIGLYPDRAPKHVQNFLEKVRSHYYDGQRIDQVQRDAPGMSFFGPSVEQIHFGLEASKEADRTKWQEERSKPSNTQLDYEDTGLSHFPGMVAAEQEPGGKKSSGERIWINANDVASRYDSDRVIFGRVIDGLDVVQRIAREPAFTEEQMRQAGQGQLQQDIQITSMEIVGDSQAGEQNGNQKGAENASPNKGETTPSNGGGEAGNGAPQTGPAKGEGQGQGGGQDK